MGGRASRSSSGARCATRCIIVGLLFNIGLWTTVKIEFFGVLACFVAFLPLERVGAGAAPALGGPADRSVDVPSSYDPACARCTGDVTAALAGDWAHRLRPVPGGHLDADDLAGRPAARARLTPGTPPITCRAPRRTRSTRHRSPSRGRRRRRPADRDGARRRHARARDGTVERP